MQKVFKNGQFLRCGFTTGSAAAGAAGAAVELLLDGAVGATVKIDLPNGGYLELPVESAVHEGEAAVAGIKKDAGDDPDVTDGLIIYASVSLRQDGMVAIRGGEGVGCYTRELFGNQAGEAAINKVPRQMITREILKRHPGGAEVKISVPGGAEIALKTFNPRLGIAGGISIIGTTGIVEPMSESAVKTSLRLEIDLYRVTNQQFILLAAGNHALDRLEGSAAVKVGNFWDEALSYSYSIGYRNFKLHGHIGKLIKLAVGCYNTHSQVCDVRLEALVYYLSMQGAPSELLHVINQCLTAEEAVEIICQNNRQSVFADIQAGIISRVKRFLKDDTIQVEAGFYSFGRGLLI